MAIRMPTSIRLNQTEHQNLKQTCKANRISLSEALKTLVTLFLNDYDIQKRVLREVQRA